MGLEVQYIDFIGRNVRKVFGENYNGLRMMELGNQHITQDELYGFSTGKGYYSSLGFNHVSIDINGMDGAIPLDLRHTFLFESFHGKFDVLTNSGTTEHVEPHTNQYECYSIIHDCVKPGGLMLHLLPDTYELDKNNQWVNHCTNYYSHSFFNMLCRECDYELLESTIINGLRCVAMVKKSNNEFMRDRDLFLNNVDVRSYK